MLADTRNLVDPAYVTTFLLLAAGWLLLSLLTAGVFGALCHGAEIAEQRQ